MSQKCVHFSWIIYGLPQEIENRQQCTFHTTSTTQCQNLCFLEEAIVLVIQMSLGGQQTL